MSGARGRAAAAVAALWLGALPAVAQVTEDAPGIRPQAVINLATTDGARLVKGEWRTSDTTIIEIDHRSPGPDLKPSGPPNRTHDLLPHAGAADFDDSKWEVIEPAAIGARRSTGRLCFNWYRIRLTLPAKAGSFDVTGATVILELVVDDYSEIWVDGRFPQVLGTTGGPMAKGFNAPNRVVLTRDARPGQTIQLAIFGMNGPVSEPPGNFIWIRSATLELYRADPGLLSADAGGRIVRTDPGLDAIVPKDAKIEKLAERFLFTEGPVWASDGFLLFSDPNANRIYRYSIDGQVSVFRTKSGYAGVDIGEYGQPGSNGLTFDREGRLTICEHGNRRITRLEKNGQITVLADRYEGKRLNSPNDLVYKSDGALYFTDPPFGLPKFFDDPRKELPYSGVFRYADGRLQLVAKDLKGPNGLAFSPDERFLYVDNWDLEKKVIMRYPVNDDGTLGAGVVFLDVTQEPGEDALDGLKVDQKGNVYVSGPGGVLILSPEGKRLGAIIGPEHPHNFAWGDDDGRALYLAAKTGLYRIRLSIPGIRPQVASRDLGPSSLIYGRGPQRDPEVTSAPGPAVPSPPWLEALTRK